MTSKRSLWVVDAGFVLAVFAVPLAFGGRHSVGEFILVCSAVLCSVGWVLHQLMSESTDWVRTRVEPLLMSILAVGLIQIVPLPAIVINTLSPAINDVLPLLTSDTSDAMFSTPWPYLSLSVSESVPGLAIGVAYVLIFIVTAQRIRNSNDAGRILKLIAVSGTAMSVFAFVQFFFSNGLYFWMIDLPQGVADDRLKGAFLNKNHFAQFVSLSVGPLIWWLIVHTESDPGKRDAGFGPSTPRRFPGFVLTTILSASLGIVITAIMISRARGAFVALSVALSALTLMLYSRSLISRKQFSVVVGAAAMGILLVGIVGHREITQVSERLNDWDNNGRVQIWNANLKVFSEFPVIGTGVGSHLYIHQRHLDTPFRTGQYTHAESSYLQIATESGLLGLGVMLACLATAFFWCFRGVRLSQNFTVTVALCGVTCSLLVSCIQSIADFVWHIPGWMVSLVLQIACACRLYQIEADEKNGWQEKRICHVPRSRVVCSMLLLIPLSGWMLSEWTPRLLAETDWSNYRKIALAERTGKDISRNIPAGDSNGPIRLQQMMRDLRAAVNRNPNDSRLHTRLAVQYTQAFHLLQQKSENALPLNQIRDAVESGGFDSHDEMLKWLSRAFGDNMQYALAASRHARRAIELNPLDGKAWLSFSELAFLDDAPAGYDRKCVEQSLRLLPNDAHVLYAAGRDARLDGDLERWADYWKKAFQRDEQIQEQIIQQMAEWTPTPVEIIVTAFEPDIPALERSVNILQSLGQTQNQRKALEVLAVRLTDHAQLPSNEQSANDWRKAAVAYSRLGASQQVESCFLHAVEASKTDFRIRLEFGTWLLEQGRTTPATEHLQWCARIAPHDPRVKDALETLGRTVRQNRVSFR